MPTYARQPFSPQPKDPPHRLIKQQATATVRTTDTQERKKCHVRSGGQCEVWETFVPLFVFDPQTMRQRPIKLMLKRCRRRVSENHHLLGGIGRRNKGRSILAKHRLDVCEKCHKDITGNVLVPIDGTKKEDAATVQYERKVLPKKSISRICTRAIRPSGGQDTWMRPTGPRRRTNRRCRSSR